MMQFLESFVNTKYNRQNLLHIYCIFYSTILDSNAFFDEYALLRTNEVCKSWCINKKSFR